MNIYRWSLGFLLLVLLVLLAGCHREPWQHTSIRNGNRDYDIAKLTYPSSSPTDGIELELIRQGKDVHGYIHVKMFELPSYEDDLHATTLTISTDSATQDFIIPLLQGGQRARLTDTCLEYLLQTLELKPSVTLRSGHFSETITGNNFQRHYDALLREASRLRPQSLVSFELF